MSLLTQNFVATKDFVARHKVAFAVATTSALCGVLHRNVIQEYDLFLIDNELYMEFHTKLSEEL